MCSPTAKDPAELVRRTDPASRYFAGWVPLWQRARETSGSYNALRRLLCPSHQFTEYPAERVIELVRHPLF